MKSIAAIALLTLSSLAVVLSDPAEAAPVFSDGFESGSTTAWNGAVGTTAQQQTVFSGAWAARATANAGSAYLYKNLSPALPELFYDSAFNVINQGNNNAGLVRFRTSAVAAVFSVLRRNDGRLLYFNEISRTNVVGPAVTAGAWHNLKVHARINGTSSQVQISLDGALVVNVTELLGTAAIGRVYVGDPAPNNTYVIAFDNQVISTSPDGEPPSTPIAFTATAGDAGRVNLAWSASSDDFGVAGYTVYRNGSALTTVNPTATSYADTAVAPSTTYSYAVDAFDAAGNRSPQSAPATVTTPAVPDTTAPTVPTGLFAAAVAADAVDLSWSAATDNVAVAGYTVYRDGAVVATTGPSPTSYSDTSVSPATTYSYTVLAFDAAANQSAPSAAAQVTTPDAADTTPPSVPTDLTAEASSFNRVDLSWSAASDDVGIAGYRLYRDGAPFATLDASATSHRDTTVAHTTTYRYTVDAFDIAGNHSAPSDTAAVTTPTPDDLVAPSTPQDLMATVRSSTQIDLAWSPSTDNVDVTGYTIYRDGDVYASVAAGVTSFADTAVVRSSTYSYSIDAFDAATNHSAPSTAVLATTPGVVFYDGFESGTTSAWSNGVGAAAQQQDVFAGAWAGRVATSGGPAYLFRNLSPVLGELFYEGRFNVLSQGNSNMSLVRFRTQGVKPVFSIMRRNDNKLAYYNEITKVTVIGPVVTAQAWHDLKVHVTIAGTASTIQVVFDDTVVAAMSKTDSLGTTPVGRIYAGDPASTSNASFNYAVDDWTVSTAADTSPPSIPTDVAADTISGTRVNITWAASTDDLAVTGYSLYRDGAPVGTVGPAALGYADGGLSPSSTYTYSVVAFDGSGNTSSRSAEVSVAAANTPAGDPVIGAAGDIACGPDDPDYNGGNGVPGNCQAAAVGTSLFTSDLAAVLPLGDEQYADGAHHKFLQSFDSSWGRLRPLSRPIAGNHEYLTPNASGYFSYFGSRAGDPATGWYSYDLGSWHLIALNGGCSFVGGCGPGSPQVQWLLDDLASHPAECTLAYWHEPRFAAGEHGGDPTYSTFWQELYRAGVDVVLNGHEHDYERFAPQDPNGNADATGMRAFVVGTGGAKHDTFTAAVPNLEVFNADSFGSLRLTLRDGGYDWEFVPVAGGTFTDSDSAGCTPGTRSFTAQQVFMPQVTSRASSSNMALFCDLPRRRDLSSAFA